MAEETVAEEAEEAEVEAIPEAATTVQLIGYTLLHVPGRTTMIIVAPFDVA